MHKGGAARREDVLRRFEAWWGLAPLYGAADDVTMRDRILDGARRCFLQYGAAKMGMHDVASVAGVSRGSVYKHFPNRRELVAAVVESGHDNFATAANQLMTGHDSLADRISVCARLMLDGRLRRTKAPGNSFAAMMGLSVASRPLLERLIAVLRPYIEIAQARGEVRSSLDVDRAAEWIARAVLGLNSGPGITFDFNVPDEIERFLREHLLPGLR
jgi:AcrR family transcriptional regulator